jgi:hypothetical protein
MLFSLHHVELMLMPIRCGLILMVQRSFCRLSVDEIGKAPPFFLPDSED